METDAPEAARGSRRTLILVAMKYAATWLEKYRLWWTLGIPAALAVAFHMWSKAPLGWMMFAFLVVLPAIGLLIVPEGRPDNWNRGFWREMLLRVSLCGIGFSIDDGLVTYSGAAYLAMAIAGSAIAVVAIRNERVARGTRDEHPFDGMPLENGEELVLKKWNPTFHRSFDFAIAVSDRALYIRRHRLFMPAAWRRFDISSIRGLRLRELRGRTELLILQEKHSDSIRTPYDTYADEKEFDRKIVREALAVLEQLGVQVTDECPPPEIALRGESTPTGLAFAAAVVICFAYYSALSNLPSAFNSVLNEAPTILALTVAFLLPAVCCGLFHFTVVRDSDLSKLRQWVQIAGAAFFAPLFGGLLALSVYGKGP